MDVYGAFRAAFRSLFGYSPEALIVALYPRLPSVSAFAAPVMVDWPDVPVQRLGGIGPGSDPLQCRFPQQAVNAGFRLCFGLLQSAVPGYGYDLWLVAVLYGNAPLGLCAVQ